MTGLERVVKAMDRELPDQMPVLPILHSGLIGLAGRRMGEFYNDPTVMADVMEWGYRQFGFDGIQLSQGVTAEAEALGAKVEQPPDAAPVLREYLLADQTALSSIRQRDPSTGGRIPLYFDAIRQLNERIGDEAFILTMLRGPLLLGSQLRGVEALLVDLIEAPERMRELLEYTTEVASELGAALIQAGGHGIILGEATCSPNFISPRHYRDVVQPFHRKLVDLLHACGWRHVGLHICGNIAPIFEDIIATGVDFLDVDYQVAASEALALADGRVTLRGNLDPSQVFRFGNVQRMQKMTHAMRQEVAGQPWIASSGCDIPPGTPAAQIEAFVRNVHE
jgi:MtaA/CmuA family methyltransferase